MQLRTQRPLNVQVDAGHPGKRIIGKKLRSKEEEERHKGLVHSTNMCDISKNIRTCQKELI
jgi:hypothetical protein